MVLKHYLKKALTTAVIFITLQSVFALDVPSLSGRVVDKANIINQKDENEITKYLTDLEDSTGIQIAVLTVKNLGGESIESYGIKVADKWKLGSKKEDNGALLLVAMDEHAVRIEVGDGLEGSLTDTKSGLIIRNVIIPEFKNGNYSYGILKGVKNMGGIASNNTELVSKSVLEEKSDDSSYLVPLIIWLIFICWMIISSKRNRKRRFGNSFGPVIYTTHNGHTTFHHSGSGGFGGGFSGGGGHFSGGGASGHW